MYIITRETAESYKAAKAAPPPVEPPPPKGVVREDQLPLGTPTTVTSGSSTETNGSTTANAASSLEVSETPPGEVFRSIAWRGKVPSQKWMPFYSKVLSRFALDKGLKLTILVEVAPEDGLSRQEIDETRGALRELGLSDEIRVE